MVDRWFIGYDRGHLELVVLWRFSSGGGVTLKLKDSGLVTGA
jgi:hypothetical protein